MIKPLATSGPTGARLFVVTAFGLFSGGVQATDPAPPPRSHLQPVSEIAARPQSGQGLGVRLSRATTVLRQQLALARGAGLVVDEVVPGTRAEVVGFRQHDVLVRLDDQLLVLPQQFDALLEAAEPGDRLVCTVLRGGREVAIPLAGQPAAVASAETVTPSSLRRPLRPTASSLALVRAVPSSPGVAGGLRRLSDETLLRQDDDFEIRLSRGDQTRLLVRDATGRVVFDGPIEKPADRGRVPQAVQRRVADMERLLEPRQTVAGEPPIRPVAEIGRLGISPVELR